MLKISRAVNAQIWCDKVWCLQFILEEGARRFITAFENEHFFLSLVLSAPLLGRGLAIFQYYIKIIPTIFQSLDGEVSEKYSFC